MSFGQIGEPRPYTGPQGPEDELASRLMSAKDYAVLTTRTQEAGSFAGFGGGAALAYAVNRFVKPRPSRNIIFLTFFSSATILSMLSTHYLLSHRIGKIREQTPAAQRKMGPNQDDPDFVSWKASQEKPFEAGVGGLEEFQDKYATTRGDH